MNALKRFKNVPIFTFVLLSIATMILARPVVAQSSLMPAAPQLAASSYILMDANSGKIIVSHNADQPLPPASLTKIMSIYIVAGELEAARISEDDRVPISVTAWKMGGSRMFVREGTEVELMDLLRGVIVQSGNDATVALAEYIAGGETAFADMMNQQAQMLGMNNSYFKNSTGWPADGHYSTARDMAMLARALIIDHPERYTLYAEREFSYNGITQSNRNGLLWRDQYVDGIKTGHTEEAGYCLVSSAKREGMRLISVVMGAKSARAREQESQKLLSYGFRYFATHQLYGAGEVISEAKVWAGQQDSFALALANPLIVTIPSGQKDNLEATVEIDRQILAPVRAGDVYGSLILKLNGELVESRDLIATSGVQQAGLVRQLWDQMILFVRGLLGLAS